MHTERFTEHLERDGYDEITSTGFPAGHALGEHAHPYDVRGLVTDGEFVIGAGGVTVVYGPGDVFELGRDTAHVEHVGPDGVSFLIGRRRSRPVERGSASTTVPDAT